MKKLIAAFAIATTIFIACNDHKEPTPAPAAKVDSTIKK